MTETVAATAEERGSTEGEAGIPESPPPATGETSTNRLPPADDRFAVEYDDEVAEPKPGSSSSANGQPPPWATVTDVNALFDLPEVAPVLEQRDAERAAQTREQIEAEYKRRNRSAETDQLLNRLSSEFGRVVQQLEAGDLEGTEKVLSRLEPMVDKVTGQARDDAMWAGVMAQGQATTAVLTSKLGRDEREEFQDYLSKGEGTPIGDAVDEYTRLKTKPVLQKKDAEIARLNDVIEKMKAEGRTGQGPNLAQSASGGGNSINSMDDADREYAAGRMPHEDYKDARARFGIK